MIIETELDIAHLELMKIFFKANDLIGVVIEEYPMEIRGRCHTMLRFTITNNETDLALTFMGVRHAGIKNMFDDYLLKCGVEVDALQPASYHRQLQDEQEEKMISEFMKELPNILNTRMPI